MVDGSTATDGSVTSAVPYMQLASTVGAAQQPGQQCLTAPQGTAGHAAAHVGVVGNHTLVVLVRMPVNVAFMVVDDQDLPELALTPVTTHHALRPCLDTHPALGSSK